MREVVEDWLRDYVVRRALPSQPGDAGTAIQLSVTLNQDLVAAARGVDAAVTLTDVIRAYAAFKGSPQNLTGGEAAFASSLSSVGLPEIAADPDAMAFTIAHLHDLDLADSPADRAALRSVFFYHDQKHVAGALLIAWLRLWEPTRPPVPVWLLSRLRAALPENPRKIYAHQDALTSAIVRVRPQISELAALLLLATAPSEFEIPAGEALVRVVDVAERCADALLRLAAVTRESIEGTTIERAWEREWVSRVGDFVARLPRER